MLHSLFKTAKKRNISIFCYQHETIDQSKIESKNITNNLVNILRRGENRFIDYINGEKSISTKNVFKFALKKNLMEAYQSIAVKIFKPDEIDTIQSVLYYPYLSFDESEFLQRAITPIQFPSPKKTK